MNMKYVPEHKIGLNIYKLVISLTVFILFSLSELLFKESKTINSIFNNPILDSFEGELDVIMIASFVLNNQIVMFLLIVIVFNYFNIYKSFMLLTTLSLSYYFSSLLKLAYMSPRPYFKSQEYTVYRCELGFGFPSTQVFSMVSFYLGLWRVLFESKTKDKTRLKYIALAGVILYLTIISVTMVINAAHYCTQIISSYGLGVCLYYIVFEVFTIDLNCGKEFYYLIRFRLVYYALIYLGMASIPVGLFFRKNPFYNDVQCKGKLDSLKLDYQYADNINLYKEDSLILLGYFLGNFFIALGVRLELVHLFKSNSLNWINFNFSSDDTKADETSGLSALTIAKIGKWNNTNAKKSFQRLLLMLLIVAICFSPDYAIGFCGRQSVYLNFFVKMFLPISLCTFSLFYVSKVLSIKMDLIKTTPFFENIQNEPEEKYHNSTYSSIKL